VNKLDSQDAYIYALAELANVKQRLQNLDGAQKDLETCQRVLDSFDAVETVVHASFYKVNADYYHVRTTFPHPSLLTSTGTKNQTGQRRICLLLQKRPSLSCLHQPRGYPRIRASFPRLQPECRRSRLRLHLQLWRVAPTPYPRLACQHPKIGRAPV